MDRALLAAMAAALVAGVLLGCVGLEPVHAPESSLPKEPASALATSLPDFTGRDISAEGIDGVSAVEFLPPRGVTVTVVYPAVDATIAIRAARRANGKLIPAHVFEVHRKPRLISLSQALDATEGRPVQSQTPTAGTPLGSVRSVRLNLNGHLPGLAVTTPWISKHAVYVGWKGRTGCYDCHTAKWCRSCHRAAGVGG